MHEYRAYAVSYQLMITVLIRDALRTKPKCLQTDNILRRIFYSLNRFGKALKQPFGLRISMNCFWFTMQRVHRKRIFKDVLLRDRTFVPLMIRLTKAQSLGQLFGSL